MKALYISVCVLIFLWLCIRCEKNDASYEPSFQEMGCCADLQGAMRRVTKPSPLNGFSSCLTDVYGITDSDYLALRSSLEEDIENLSKTHIAYAAESKKIMHILRAELSLIKSIEANDSVAARERAASMRDSYAGKATPVIKNIHQKIIEMAYFGHKNIPSSHCGEHTKNQGLHICPWQESAPAFLARAKNILGHYFFIFATKLDQENTGWRTVAQRGASVKIARI